MFNMHFLKKALIVLLVVSGVAYASGMNNQSGMNAQGMNAQGMGQKSKKMMKMFQSVPPQKATILQNGKAKMFCPSCGMTLPMFYKTNHALTHNGHVKQYCSIHCMVEDHVKNGVKLNNPQVVDVTSLKFIPVKDATYVVGSEKKGTMSMVSKYAFAKRSDAQKFADKFGGKLMNFDGAYKVAVKALDKEIAMISKKQAMMAKKGQMIYNKMCKKTDEKFASTAEAKAFVMQNHLCGNLHGKKLQAVGLYLSKRK